MQFEKQHEWATLYIIMILKRVLIKINKKQITSQLNYN